MTMIINISDVQVFNKDTEEIDGEALQQFCELITNAHNSLARQVNDHPIEYTGTSPTNLYTAGVMNGAAIEASHPVNRVFLRACVNENAAIFYLQHFDGSDWVPVTELQLGEERVIMTINAGEQIRVKAMAKDATNGVLKQYTIKLRYE